MSLRQAADLYSAASSSKDQQANISLAEGLRILNEALLATLTQMSADIAELKAEVQSLKARSTPGFQPGLHKTAR
jgi:hypothetical protein